MSQLGALDAAFLYAETAQTPMNLGTLHVLQLPDDYAGDFVAEVRALVAKRLHLAPVLHRRLIQMPYDLLTPMWVEDDDIDLDHHVRHVLLQRPGDEAQLRALVGRLHSQQLDRSRHPRTEKPQKVSTCLIAMPTAFACVTRFSSPSARRAHRRCC